MYYAKVEWYDDYNDKDCVDHMIICAADWVEAMQKVNGQFTYINSINMEQICTGECDVVYISEDMVDKIKEHNDY